MAGIIPSVWGSCDEPNGISMWPDGRVSVNQAMLREEESRCWIQSDLGLNPALPLPRDVTLRGSAGLSKPQYLQLVSTDKLLCSLYYRLLISWP